jgi:hypothetical protein
MHHPGIRERHPDQESVDVLFFQTGVRDRFSRDFRHQAKGSLVAGILERFEFADSDCRGFSFQAHRDVTPYALAVCACWNDYHKTRLRRQSKSRMPRHKESSPRLSRLTRHAASYTV